MNIIYTVHGLDVWGNDEDGYDVNDVYPSRGTVEIADNASDAEVMAALCEAGYIDAGYDMAEVHIDGDDLAEHRLQREASV